jgi:hypothetical protein
MVGEPLMRAPAGLRLGALSVRFKRIDEPAAVLH